MNTFAVINGLYNLFRHWAVIKYRSKKKKAGGKGGKERYIHLNAEFQRRARGDEKAFLCNQCKEVEDNTEWERLEISLGKSEIPREHFMQRWAQ